MLQIDVKTDSARQTEANGKILDKLSKACCASTSSRTSKRCKQHTAMQNWASNAPTRRSTSGGVLMQISHYIKSLSKPQSLIALSSAESELYALVNASAEAMDFQSVMRDLGESWSTVVCSDASAALGVIQFQSLEKDDNYWFVQSLNARNVVQYAKVSGSNTPADVCTKGLNAELMAKHVSVLDGRYSARRSTLSQEILWNAAFGAKQLLDAELS